MYADAIVELTDTGSSLQLNDLKPIYTAVDATAAAADRLGAAEADRLHTLEAML